MTDYYSAAVCRRGHAETIVLERTGSVANRCTTCGAEVLRGCPECGRPIRGAMPNVLTPYVPPDFCDNCGSPFPWLSRQGLIYQLENVLDDVDLDPATKLEVREQLEALTAPELEEEEQLRRWRRVKEKAPELWQASGAQRILESLVSAAIKSQLGL